MASSLERVHTHPYGVRRAEEPATRRRGDHMVVTQQTILAIIRAARPTFRFACPITAPDAHWPNSSVTVKDCGDSAEMNAAFDRDQRVSSVFEPSLSVLAGAGMTASLSQSTRIC